MYELQMIVYEINKQSLINNKLKLLNNNIKRNNRNKNSFKFILLFFFLLIIVLFICLYININKKRREEYFQSLIEKYVKSKRTSLLFIIFSNNLYDKCF
jgi:hypothetical protein